MSVQEPPRPMLKIEQVLSEDESSNNITQMVALINGGLWYFVFAGRPIGRQIHEGVRRQGDEGEKKKIDRHEYLPQDRKRGGRTVLSRSNGFLLAQSETGENLTKKALLGTSWSAELSHIELIIASQEEVFCISIFSQKLEMRSEKSLAFKICGCRRPYL